MEIETYYYPIFIKFNKKRLKFFSESLEFDPIIPGTKKNIK